jgi:DNA-binding NarL/FixJ family response regulator
VSRRYEPLEEVIYEVASDLCGEVQISESALDELTRIAVDKDEAVLISVHHLDSEIETDLTDELAKYSYASCLCVPLVSTGSQIGVLHLFGKAQNAFSNHDSRIVALTGTVLLSALERSGYTTSTSDALTALLPDLGEPRIGIVDNKPQCQQTLSTIVNRLGFDVYDKSATLEQYFKSFDRSEYDGPTVLLWEIHDPEEVNLCLLRQCLDGRLNPKVVLIDHGCGFELLGAALRSGVVGFLQRGSSIETLETALLNVLGDGVSVDRNVLENYFNQNSTSSFRWSEKYSAILEQLDDRDIAILQSIANGESNAEIAAELNFAVGTIKNRLARIYKIFGTTDRAGAMATAIRSGIIT